MVFQCRRCAVLLVLVMACGMVSPACNSSGDRTVPAHDAGVRTSKLAAELAQVEPSPKQNAASRYYEGYLLETLHGDVPGARKAYQQVVAESGEVTATIAARAALRLAELELLAGRQRRAFELAARAWVLGRDDVDIVEKVDDLTLRAGGSDVRGPPIGVPLQSVSPTTAASFARAEALLQIYHRIRLEPRLEQLRAGVRAKERAMDAALRGYRAVLNAVEPIALVAAEFRGASLHHDLALSLMFELPPELEPRARERLRRSLSTSAMTYLRRAKAAYGRSLEHAARAQLPTSERWVIAADVGLRSVGDLLGDRK